MLIQTPSTLNWTSKINVCKCMEILVPEIQNVLRWIQISLWNNSASQLRLSFALSYNTKNIRGYFKLDVVLEVQIKYYWSSYKQTIYFDFAEDIWQCISSFVDWWLQRNRCLLRKWWSSDLECFCFELISSFEKEL